MCSKARKTIFNADWNNPFVNPSWAKWLRENPNDSFSANCLLCKNSFSLSNMGKQAILSHERGKKHRKAVASRQETLDIKTFLTSKSNPSSTLFRPIPEESNVVATVACEVRASENERTVGASQCMKRFLLKDDVTRAEAIWCMDVVMGHRSNSSSANTVSLFDLMFPDSQIASAIKLQKDKIAYTVTYGLAPFFRHSFSSVLCQSKYFVIGFDESLNKVSQKEQMDFFIRFLDEDKQEVRWRYFDSKFLGHTTAEDLLKAFKETFKNLDLKKLIQVSMDGPNVNWKFFRCLKEDISESAEDPTILNVGSCGLHVINGAFKSGIKSTGWSIIEFLRYLYNLFKLVPARRADYSSITHSSLFALKFCSIRWTENVKVVERALNIIPNVKLYVEQVEKLGKAPECNSFKFVSHACKDPLLAPKLSFFRSLAGEVEPFLRKFQSDSPLFPFLHEELYVILKRVMARFVKKSVLDQADTARKLCKIKLSVDNLMNARDIDLGYATRSSIRASGKLSEIKIYEFRQQALTCFITFTEKFISKSPLTYKLTLGASCLNPEIMLDANRRSNRIQAALEVLVDNNWFSGVFADRVSKHYEEFCSNAEVITEMKSFNLKDSRLDHVLFNLLQSHGHQDLRELISFLLILSHGNAGLERGFSVNKNCLVENLHETSLIAQRLVYDSIASAGGIRNVLISKSLLQYIRNAKSASLEALKHKEFTSSTEIDQRQRKRQNQLKIKQLQQKKVKILSDAKTETNTIDSEIKSILNTV